MRIGLAATPLALLLASGNCFAQPTPTPAPTPAGNTIVIDGSIRSSIMNEDRRMIIHLPRNYENEATKKYPVMYVLDGTSQDDHTAETLRVLSDAGIAPATIVIGLPNTRGNRERDQTPTFMRRNVDDDKSPYGEGDKFLAFIEKELIPFIDGKYRTSGYRMIAGNSRGGLFVLYTLIERPDLFQARFCYSTPVWRFENLIVGRLATSLASRSTLGGFLYFAVGDRETDQIKGGLEKLVESLKRNSLRRFEWVAERTPYADHQDNALIATSRALALWAAHFKKLPQ